MSLEWLLWYLLGDEERQDKAIAKELKARAESERRYDQRQKARDLEAEKALKNEGYKEPQLFREK